jgi:MFS family permease
MKPETPPVMIKKEIFEKLENLYDKINDEEDARICKEISDDACRYTPVNYFLILLSNTLSKLGDALSNPKTVLAWIMSYVQAPVFLISFIVPIRESGSMMPQIIISSYIRKKEVRKWVWVAGSLIQFISIAAIGLVAISMTGTGAGIAIILLLVLFSLARGLCSVAFKDVMGKTIPKTRRGRLKGFTTSFSGILVLAAGLFLIYKSSEEQSIEFYAYLIMGAAALWLLAAIVYSGIKEFPGETSGGRNGLKEAFKKIDLLRKDKPFRNFVISRSLLLCSALTAPFYILLAHNFIGKESYLLGLFIIANGLASVISAPFWGKMADRSSKRVMVIGAIITSALGILIFLIVSLSESLRNQVWLYPVAYFMLGIAHSGVRIGRKTYIVDMAGGNKRTDYVAVGNTIIGLVLLITGGISALASIISVEGIILALSLFGIAGAITSSKLPQVE